jgi:NAD(P)-dependent dehydrogenase (short-subunit alcohol dehydrogenase family)
LLPTPLAIELAPHNIQVNAIATGWIESEVRKGFTVFS